MSILKKSFVFIILFVFFIYHPCEALDYNIHTVKKGESLYKISLKYNTAVENIRSINNLTGDMIIEGSKLKIAELYGTDIRISLNGSIVNTDSFTYIDNQRTMVPARFVSEALGGEVCWLDNAKAAVLIFNDTVFFIPAGFNIVYVNGKRYILDVNADIINNRIYIPIRFFAEMVNVDVGWDQENRTVVLSDALSKSTRIPAYDYEDLYWLSRIINAEAEGESVAGKIAVANVIINRVGSADYPDSIKEVVFDNRFGWQFTPAATGTIYNVPTYESIVAAKTALCGYVCAKDATFFLNPKASTNYWIMDSRKFVESIGAHLFYK